MEISDRKKGLTTFKYCNQIENKHSLHHPVIFLLVYDQNLETPFNVLVSISLSLAPTSSKLYRDKVSEQNTKNYNVFRRKKEWAIASTLY